VILYLDLLENMRGLDVGGDGRSRKKEKGSEERDARSAFGGGGDSSWTRRAGSGCGGAPHRGSGAMNEAAPTQLNAGNRLFNPLHPCSIPGMFASFRASPTRDPPPRDLRERGRPLRSHHETTVMDGSRRHRRPFDRSRRWCARPASHRL
jgi:hypothetical protein